MLPNFLLILAVAQGPTPISLKLNHEQFSRGDHARVYIQTAQDGYLVVLHADPQGRVRILFPRDPIDEAFVRGGKRQEVRGRSDRDAFLIEDEDGAGTVVAAVSRAPLRFDGYMLNGHWDYRTLGQGSVKDDPLAGLLDIVRRMTDSSSFDYDAASYVVGRQVASYGHYYGYPYPRFRAGRFGYGGGDPFCYDPVWSWSASCYGFGSGFGFGFGYSYYRPRSYFGRPYLGGGFGSRGGTRFVIPQDRGRFVPIQPRPRTAPIARPAKPFSTGRSFVPRVRTGVSRPAPRPSGGTRRH
ncbi:MAG: DUF4384 domain-containing protein [Gemmatimonadales bacterium]